MYRRRSLYMSRLRLGSRAPTTTASEDYIHQLELLQYSTAKPTHQQHPSSSLEAQSSLGSIAISYRAPSIPSPNVHHHGLSPTIESIHEFFNPKLTTNMSSSNNLHGLTMEQFKELRSKAIAAKDVAYCKCLHFLNFSIASSFPPSLSSPIYPPHVSLPSYFISIRTPPR